MDQSKENSINSFAKILFQYGNKIKSPNIRIIPLFRVDIYSASSEYPNLYHYYIPKPYKT